MVKRSKRLAAFDRRTGLLKLGIVKLGHLIKKLKKKGVSENSPASWEHLRLIRTYENQNLALKKELNLRTSESTNNQKTTYLTDSPIRLVQGGSPGLKKL